jgi:hypothetical protein
MLLSRKLAGVPVLLLIGLLVGGLAWPAFADDPRDVSVGGVWVARITAPAGGRSAEDRVLDITRQITEVLSDPRYSFGAPVTVRQMGSDAWIVVGDRVVMTVAPADTGGVASTSSLARTWAARLAEGLTQARQGSAVYTLR